MTDDSLGHKAAIQALVVCVCDFLYTLFSGFFFFNSTRLFLLPRNPFCIKKKIFIYSFRTGSLLLLLGFL